MDSAYRFPSAWKRVHISFATLENLLLGFGLWSAPISHPNPTRGIVSRSGFLIPSLLALMLSPPALLLSFFLDSLRQGVLFYNWKKMAARRYRIMHGVTQSEMMVPLITGELAFGEHVRKLVLGVNIVDLDFGGPSWFCQTTNRAQLCCEMLSTPEKLETDGQSSTLNSPLVSSGCSMLNHTVGTYSRNVMMDYPRIPISEWNPGKFPDSMEFQSWKVNFRSEVCLSTADPQITMHWIKEVVIATSIDELMT